MRYEGWILDIYPCQQGMTLWLLTSNQTRHRLIDAFSPAFYVHGSEQRLGQLEQLLERNQHTTTGLTERINLFENRPITVLEVSTKQPTEFRSLSSLTHKFDS